jgi:hypothetical protein
MPFVLAEAVLAQVEQLEAVAQVEQVVILLAGLLLLQLAQ